jgi:hypothetical protein
VATARTRSPFSTLSDHSIPAWFVRYIDRCVSQTSRPDTGGLSACVWESQARSSN